MMDSAKHQYGQDNPEMGVAYGRFHLLNPY